MTNEMVILVVAIESVAILGAFFLHRSLTGVRKEPQDDPERLMEKFLESQLNAARFQAIAKQNALKHSATLRDYMTGFGGGYISFFMPDSKKTILHELLRGFGEYAKQRGYEFRFLIDPSRADEIKFKFILDPVGQNDRPPQLPQDFQDYLDMLQKRGSLGDLPVVSGPPEDSLLSRICAKAGGINFLMSRCILLDYREKFLSELAAQGDQKFPGPDLV